MNNVINNYVNSKNDLKSYFNCENDYFFKVITDFNWQIKSNDGIHILTYWKDGENLNECVIVKKDNNPLIYKTAEYSLIICIECIKIGLIVKNN